MLEHLVKVLQGRYAVEKEVGRGGMATVYRARDIRHDRDVAIKVFHPEVASVVGAERFLQEIRVTAKLQHPHILPLYDSGVEDGLLFYVMPFVDGESLRDLLNRDRQLPIETAVRITREVASALDYAHRHAIVHRDIKPENILLQDGQALVADFGIARAMSAVDDGRLTQTGLSLGTPQYMSPEQAAGDRMIDGRTDVFSLSAVLYELLVGAAPHEGATAQAVVAKIMTEPAPDVRRHRTSVPVELAMALERGLARIPADRFQSAKELADALAGGSRLVPSVRNAMATARTAPFVFASLAVGVIVGLGAAWLALPRRGAVASVVPTVRFTLQTPLNAPVSASDLSSIAVSSDGTTLAYVGDTPSGRRLFLRRLADTMFVELKGSANAVGPFFSPDGQSLGYFAEGKLRRVRFDGAAPVDLADAALARGAVWTANGSILFTSAPGSGVWSVPDGGGKPTVVTRLDSLRGERTHRFAAPAGGGRILATVRSSGQPSFNQSEIAVFAADGSKRHDLVSGGSQARVLPGDILVFVRSNTLFGVRLSPDHEKRIGEPVALVDNVMTEPSTGAAQYAVSDNGTLAYVIGGDWRPERVVSWAAGRTVTRLIKDERSFATPRMSPDGRKVAVIVEDANDDIWVYDAISGGGRRLTFAGGSHVAPVWSPDGKSLAYGANLAGHYNVYVGSADGSGTPLRIAPSEDVQFPSSWSPDGKRLAFTSSSVTTGYDVWISDPTGGESQPFLSSSFNESGAKFSPDQKWIAYVSDETGREEIYLRSYPAGVNQVQLSTLGGTDPHWVSAERLYYRRQEDLVSVDLRNGRVVSSSERVVAAGAVAGGRVLVVSDWDIHPRGGLVVVTSNRRALPTGIQVVTGWLREVERRLR